MPRASPPGADGGWTVMAEASVSICIPAYDPDPQILLALLESIAAQAHPRLEVVVCDDASRRSETPAILANAPQRLTVRCFRNDQNLGMVGNWNQVVRYARGALIMVVSQDDELTPGMIARYEREFDDPGVVLCSAGEVFIGEHGQPARRREPVNRRHRIYRHQHRYVLEQGEVIRLSLRNGQGFGEPSAVMFRREVFEAVNGYRDAFEHAADVDLNIRLAGMGKAVYLAAPLLRRRIHAGNLTHAHVASGASSRDRLRLHAEYAAMGARSPRECSRLRVALVSFALRDALRAIRMRRWPVVRLNLVAAWRHKRAHPRFYLERAREIVTKRNLDEW